MGEGTSTSNWRVGIPGRWIRAWEGRVCGLRQGLVVQASPQDFQLCRKFFPLWQH